MEFIKGYKDKMSIARQIRNKMEEAGKNIVMRSHNIRKFKKATSFPVIAYEHRNFHDLGEWYVCVTAESRSRFLAGIFGVCAFQIEKSAENNISDILLVEGDDDGNILLEEYDLQFLDDYTVVHNIVTPTRDYLSVFLKFYRENYFSNRKGLGYSFVHKEENGKEHIAHPFIMATPVGVAMGITNENNEGHYYFKYESAEKYFSDKEELLEKVTDAMLDYINDMEKNPFKYSPLKNII